MRLDKKHLGHAEITSEKTVVAGSVISTTIEYTVGAYGMDDSGNIRIAWRSVSDWEGPQFDDPKGFGYSTVTSDRDVVLHYKKNVHQRPFHNCLDIKVRDGDLFEGDKIKIVLGDRSQGSPGIRVQTFCESEHEYRVYADPLNTGRFELLGEIPTMKVVNGPVNEVQVVVPSKVEVDKEFDIVVRLLDEWGNPCKDFVGEVGLSEKNGSKNLIIPEKVSLDSTNEGYVRIPGNKIIEKGIYHVAAEYDKHGIACVSNGMKCGESHKYNLYWGDAHGQTSSTIGTGSLDEYFSFAKGPSAIDFTGWQGNDFEITDDKWKDVKAATKKYNEEGRFLTFLGYEWSGNFPGGGDHNVYFLGDDDDYYPHCSWSAGSDHENCKNDSYTKEDLKVSNNRYPLTELHAEFKGRDDVMVWPHIGGRPGNLDYYNEDLCPVIEIHSHHGTFEWFARDAMERGLKVGFIATSDDHTCRPGLSYPLQNVKQMAAAFDVTSGFTAVYAKDLTKEAIWEAIKKRRVYATTFARIALGVSIGDVFMGEEFNSSENPEINIDVTGTGPIKTVEIINGTETIYKENFQKNDVKTALKKVKIMWEGVATRGRRKSTNWDGTLTLSKGKINNVSDIAFDRIEQGLTSVTNQWIEWHSTTSGDMDGLLLEIDAPDDAEISFTSGPVAFRVKVGELTTVPQKFQGGGVNLNATIVVVEDDAENTYDVDTFTVNTKFTDSNPRQGMNQYWVKVVQEDGHMAWSSPIFMNKEAAMLR